MTGTPVRLSRSLFGRLFGGTMPQMACTLFLVISVPLMLSGGDEKLRLGAVDVVVVVLWVFGLTAWADADREGVRWRGFVRRRFSWAEIERVAVVRPLPAALHREVRPGVR